MVTAEVFYDVSGENKLIGPWEIWMKFLNM